MPGKGTADRTVCPAPSELRPRTFPQRIGRALALTMRCFAGDAWDGVLRAGGPAREVDRLAPASAAMLRLRLRPGQNRSGRPRRSSPGGPVCVPLRKGENPLGREGVRSVILSAVMGWCSPAARRRTAKRRRTVNPPQGPGPQERPVPFSTCTTQELWTDPHRSAQMLRLHLDGARALASGTARTVEATVGWIVETFRPGSGDAVLDLGCGPGLYTHRLARTGGSDRDRFLRSFPGPCERTGGGGGAHDPIRPRELPGGSARGPVRHRNDDHEGLLRPVAGQTPPVAHHGG
jgi:hypothetical protein